jgi:hypothetical protein
VAQQYIHMKDKSISIILLRNMDGDFLRCAAIFPLLLYFFYDNTYFPHGVCADTVSAESPRCALYKPRAKLTIVDNVGSRGHPSRTEDNKTKLERVHKRAPRFVTLCKRI